MEDNISGLHLDITATSLREMIISLNKAIEHYMQAEQLFRQMFQSTEIIRCCRCKYYKFDRCHNEQWETERGNFHSVKQDDYCSYAEMAIPIDAYECNATSVK